MYNVSEVQFDPAPKTNIETQNLNSYLLLEKELIFGTWLVIQKPNSCQLWKKKSRRLKGVEHLTIVNLNLIQFT